MVGAATGVQAAVFEVADSALRSDAASLCYDGILARAVDAFMHVSKVQFRGIAVPD